MHFVGKSMVSRCKKRIHKLFSAELTVASHGRMARRDRFADLRERIEAESPLIVDGGANTGQMIDLFLRQYRSPTIHAFEPIPELAKALRDKYRGRENVIIHENALGAENGSVSFKVLNSQGSSSILSPSDALRAYHGTKMEVEREIAVQQVRLDDILSEEIHILKLDLQGYELEALKGCYQLLEQIKTITTEVEFIPLYEGQPLFSDIDLFLRDNGFRLLNLYELWTHPDGQLTAGDAVYLNERYF